MNRLTKARVAEGASRKEEEVNHDWDGWGLGDGVKSENIFSALFLYLFNFLVFVGFSGCWPGGEPLICCSESPLLAEGVAGDAPFADPPDAALRPPMEAALSFDLRDGGIDEAVAPEVRELTVAENDLLVFVNVEGGDLGRKNCRGVLRKLSPVRPLR